MPTVRQAAILWLAAKFGITGNAVCASKLHVRESLWWIDIPQQKFENPKSTAIDLLCEITPGASEFHYLRVPVDFFKKEKSKLDVNAHGVLRLHLSAEPDKMFVDQRGSGRISFGRFLTR